MPDARLEGWREMSPLLDELLDLDDASRARRLEALRQEDAVLASRLAELLGGMQATAGFLARPSIDGDTGTAGQRVGAYTLERPIGRGGMSSVWLARRSDGHYEAKAAVKFLDLSRVGRTGVGVERFRQEGAMLARLAHPHIARLLDAGTCAADQPYLLIEYVEGEPIDCWCDARALGIRARLGLVMAVLDAVAHAHRHLILHRDLKPSNIHVDAEGRVKLLDFGIAKLLDNPDQAATAGDLTHHGGRAFTPRYASPEQVQGDEVSMATDVYALGVLLYELLSGAHPTSAKAGDDLGDLRALVEAEPAPMSEAAARATVPTAAHRSTTPRQLAQALRGDLDNIVAKALAKSPDRRYGTVEALADDLRRHLCGMPVHAHADSATYRLAKFVRRHRGGVVAGVFSTLALVVGLAATAWQAQRAQVERDLAVEQLVYSEAVEEFLSFLLGSTANKPFTTSELLDRGQAFAARQFAAEPGLQARLLLVLAEQYSELDSVDKLEPTLDRAYDLAKHSGKRELVARVDCLRALRVNFETDAARAKSMFDAAIAELGGPMVSTALANCHYNRSQLAFEMNDIDEAENDLRAALAALAAPRPGTRPLATAIRAQSAGNLSKRGELAGSIRQLKQVVDEFEAMGRGRTAAASTALNNLGVIQDRAGQRLQALRSVDAAVMAIGSDDDFASARVEGTRARNLLAMGRDDGAVAAFERALRLTGARGDKSAYADIVLAFPRCELGDPAACATRFEGALHIQRKLLPPGHPTLGSAELTGAQIALQRHDVHAARAHLLEAIRILEASAPTHPHRVYSLALLARVEIRLGDLTRALAHAMHAVELGRRLLGGLLYSDWLGHALLAEALVHLASGDVQRASPLLREALANLEPTLGDLAPATIEVKRLMAPM